MGNDITDKATIDKELNDHIFLVQASPWSWSSKAKKLRHAADRLYSLYKEGFTRFHNDLQINPKMGKLSLEDELDLYDSHMIDEVYLLIGYAIENLLKGLLVEKFPEKITTTSKIKLGSHNLFDIAKECNLSLSSRQNELLRSLEHTITWQGKYPIPLNANNVKYQATHGFTPEELEEIHRSNYQEMTDIYTLILTEFQSIPRP